MVKRILPGDVSILKNCQTVTEAEFINKRGRFILLLCDIYWQELYPNIDQIVKQVFVTSLYF